MPTKKKIIANIRLLLFQEQRRLCMRTDGRTWRN